MTLIRKALPADNIKLLKLTSLTPMQGKISLRIDRDPDFFKLLVKRGISEVFVAEKYGEIVGCFSVSGIESIVNGIFERVYYLSDLKVHPSLDNGNILARLLKIMADYVREMNADLLFCTAAHGNEKVFPLFDGRAGFPKFQYAGAFNVYQIIPLPGKISPGKYSLEETETSGKVTSFYNKFCTRYQMAPFYSIPGMQETNTLAALESGDIKALLTLTDMSSSKQNVLIGLPFVLNLLIRLLKLLTLVIPLINLPEKGKPVKILYIKAFAFEQNSEHALELLIKSAIKLAFREKYCYLTVGIHERDPMAKFFTKYLHFTFRSMGFIQSINGNKEKISKILSGAIFEDYSLV